ncbi:MAG TPA: formate dehydrogenase subunit gamma [Geminicoccaceae bacterium]|nr:formate dehydrogenase subunit gamma [Geminicoccaceae bacterium]
MIAILRALALLVLVAALAAAPGVGPWPGDRPALAQEQVPGGALGDTSDADFWRAIRQGESFSTTLPDPKAATLIQSEGDNWRAIRNGPLSTYGAWALLGILAVLALFFVLRGRIRLEHGWSGQTITRFNFLERFTHWLTATCFVVLALTGLNMLYGRYVLRPLIGPEAFSMLTLGGKYAHNYLAFGFMIGLVLMFVLWAWQNLPNRHDLVWLAKGGGMFTKGTHPPAKKFNAGQKLLFWLVILAGVSVSLSGLMLMFPFEYAAFGPTFGWINSIVGTELPTALAPIQEMQLAQLWHAIVGLFLTAVIIAHIYIGTIGMEGAFAAMGSGEVDANWAREHHSLWVQDLKGKEAYGAGDD